MKLVALSPAKINLFLNIFDKRLDGYHELETLMIKLYWGDQVRLEIMENSREISIRVPNHPEISNESNLAYRAAKLYQERSHMKFGLSIEIEKKIFMGGGLGGGSSNAGVVLMLLNQHFNTFSANELAELGAQLGSDVPFFTRAESAAFCYGRGEMCQFFNPSEKLSGVLLNPNVHVSTAQIYQALNRSLTSKKVDDTNVPLFDRANNSLFESISRGNDMQVVVEGLVPSVREARLALLKEGAHAAQMSGSGATVFSVFENIVSAEKAANNLQQKGKTVVTTTQS